MNVTAEKDALSKNEKGGRTQTIQIDAADAYMIASAMQLASNIALVSGTPHALERLNHYRKLFLSFAPAAAEHFARDTDLAEIIMAMNGAETWHSFQIREQSWHRNKVTYIKVGRALWVTKGPVDPAQHDEIVAMVRSMAPDCCKHMPLPG